MGVPYDAIFTTSVETSQNYLPGSVTPVAACSASLRLISVHLFPWPLNFSSWPPTILKKIVAFVLVVQILESSSEVSDTKVLTSFEVF